MIFTNIINAIDRPLAKLSKKERTHKSSISGEKEIAII